MFFKEDEFFLSSSFSSLESIHEACGFSESVSGLLDNVLRRSEMAKQSIGRVSYTIQGIDSYPENDFLAHLIPGKDMRALRVADESI